MKKMTINFHLQGVETHFWYIDMSEYVLHDADNRIINIVKTDKVISIGANIRFDNDMDVILYSKGYS